MIEMELKYRDLVVSKANNESQFRSNIDQTQGNNLDMKSQIENMKEQIHLL